MNRSSGAFVQTPTAPSPVLTNRTGLSGEELTSISAATWKLAPGLAVPMPNCQPAPPRPEEFPFTLKTSSLTVFMVNTRSLKPAGIPRAPLVDLEFSLQSI